MSGSFTQQRLQAADPNLAYHFRSTETAVPTRLFMATQARALGSDGYT